MTSETYKIPLKQHLCWKKSSNTSPGQRGESVLRWPWHRNGGGIWAEISGASCGMKSWGPWENHRDNGGFMGFDGILWDITTITTGWW